MNDPLSQLQGTYSPGQYVNPWGYSSATPSVPNPAYQGASAPVTGMDLGSLTSYINALNQIGSSAANAGRIPQGTALEKASSKNISSELGGNVPPDVLRQMQQQGAERGVATGTGNSANNNAAYLQALGLTSLDMQQMGQKNLSAADARNPAAPLFDPSSQLISPYQAQGLGQSAKSEADQVALAQQRMAMAGGGGGAVSGLPDTGGAPTTGGGYPGPDMAYNMYGPVSGGNPASDLYGPQAGNIDYSGLASNTDTTSQPIADWSSLFSPGLGLDQSLYGS